MIRPTPVRLSAILTALWVITPAAALARHAGHGAGSMDAEAMAPRVSAPGRHLEGVAKTFKNMETALQKVTASINAVGAPGEGRLDVRQPLLALEVKRTSSTIGRPVADPRLAGDAGAAAESLHAAVRNVEHLTKTLEGLTRSLGRAVGP